MKYLTATGWFYIGFLAVSLIAGILLETSCGNDRKPRLTPGSSSSPKTIGRAVHDSPSDLFSEVAA